MKVLIVDSDSITLKALEAAYAIRGFIVLTALTSIEAWNKLIDPQRSRKMPDLIILDPMNVGMNGIDLLRKIKSMTTLVSVPVIVASVDEELIDRSIMAGATAGLSKPLSIDATVKLSKRLLAEHSSNIEPSAYGYMTGPMSLTAAIRLSLLRIKPKT